MIDPPIYFTTFHGPIVGDWWCVRGGNWSCTILRVIEDDRHPVIEARAQWNGHDYFWNLTTAEFADEFDRV